jgi:hypothetical protein
MQAQHWDALAVGKRIKTVVYCLLFGNGSAMHVSVQVLCTINHHNEQHAVRARAQEGKVCS